MKLLSRGIYLSAIAAVLGFPQLAQAQTARPVVAVESVQGPSGAEVPTLRTMIETAILATNRFTVMNSSEYDSMRASQGRCESGMVMARNGKCQKGQFVDPDYRISATVTSAGITRSINKMIYECNYAQAYISIDIRITDKSTGQIKSSGQIDIKGTNNSNCGRDAAPAGASLDDVIRPAADAIAARLVFASFPVEVLATQTPTRVVLSYGQGVLQMKTKYDLFGPSATLKDSRGNSYQVDNKVGTVEIISVAPGTSVGEVICTVGGALPQVGFTARPALNPKAKRIKAPKGSTTPGECT